MTAANPVRVHVAVTAAEVIRPAGYLTPVPFALAAAVWIAGQPAPWLAVTLIMGLLAFGVVVAVKPSVQSYLIFAFGQAERITWDGGLC